MKDLKYVIRTMLIFAPAATMLWLGGATYIHFLVLLGLMCYSQLLEINDKLKNKV